MATIVAEIDRKRILCRVKAEVLSKKFQIIHENPMLTVAKHKDDIEKVIRNLISRMRFEEDGSILIRYDDF